MAQFNFGDNNFGNRSHHGTTNERGAVVVRGFEASFRENKNLNEAIQDSTAYVLSV